MMPIYDLISGWVDKFKNYFKLTKTAIDLKEEEKINQIKNLTGNDIILEVNKFKTKF